MDWARTFFIYMHYILVIKIVIHVIILWAIFNSVKSCKWLRKVWIYPDNRHYIHAKSSLKWSIYIRFTFFIFLSGKTNTREALEKSIDLFDELPPRSVGVPKILLLVTDGGTSAEYVNGLFGVVRYFFYFSFT